MSNGFTYPLIVTPGTFQPSSGSLSPQPDLKRRRRYRAQVVDHVTPGSPATDQVLANVPSHTRRYGEHNLIEVPTQSQLDVVRVRKLTPVRFQIVAVQSAGVGHLFAERALRETRKVLHTCERLVLLTVIREANLPAKVDLFNRRVIGAHMQTIDTVKELKVHPSLAKYLI